MVPVTARLTNDALELKRIDELIVASSPRNVQRTSLLLNGFAGVLYTAIGLVRVSSPGGRWPDRGYLWLAFGLFYFLMVAIAYRANRVPARRRNAATMTESNVTVSDTGLRFMPSARALPWKSIFGVRNVGGYVVFVARNGAFQAAVSKNDLANDGRDLWLALDDLLVSKRYLIRAAMPTQWMTVDPRAAARALENVSYVRTSPG